MVQDAKAASRKAGGIHNPADRACAHAKAGGLGPGELPKDKVKANEREKLDA